MSISLNKTRYVNLVTHFNIQNKSLRKLSSEYNKLSTVVYDHVNNSQKSYTIDVTSIPRQLRLINQTIVRICKEFVSTRDIVNIYQTFSKSHLYKLIESPNSLGYFSIGTNNLINQISKEGHLKFTLFSLEQQCLKLISVIYPYQIAILLSSHIRMGRFNEIFITELLNSFARLNNQDSKIRIPFYNPNTLSLMVHIVNICMKKGINPDLLDNVIDFILSESKNCANKFMPLDTVTLTYSLLKYGLELHKISNILLLILTRGNYDIKLLHESIEKFEDLQHLSLLTNVLSCCFPVTSGLIKDNIEYNFRINMWSIILSRYFTLLSQYNMDNLSIHYKNLINRFGINIDQNTKSNLDFSVQMCEKLTNSLVSLSKAFELDYSIDNIRLTKCGIIKSKRVIYHTYRLAKICTISNEENYTLDTDDIFYGIYGKLYIFADIICNIIRFYINENVELLAPLTISNSVNALSRLHIQQYDYFTTIGDYILNESNLVKFSQNCIALICNSFSDCKFQHKSIYSLLLRFIKMNTKPNVIDFYHIIITLRKFGIYSPIATRWIIDTCTKDYLNLLSSHGLISLLSYLMAYNFYLQPMGFILTHYLAIKIGELVPENRNYELISQYKICSLIYHTFTPQLLDLWIKSEVDDMVSAKWLKSKASDMLYQSLLYRNINGTNLDDCTNPSTFAIDVASVLKTIGHKVKLEYNKDPYYIDIIMY